MLDHSAFRCTGQAVDFVMTALCVTFQTFDELVFAAGLLQCILALFSPSHSSQKQHIEISSGQLRQSKDKHVSVMSCLRQITALGSNLSVFTHVLVLIP